MGSNGKSRQQKKKKQMRKVVGNSKKQPKENARNKSTLTEMRNGFS
jgi:hypothetical protein